MCVCCSLVCLSGCYWFGISSLKRVLSLFPFEASAHTVTHWQDARYCASLGAESTVGPASASSGRTVAAVLSYQLWYVHWPCEIVGNVNTQIFDVLHSLHLFTIYGKWGFFIITGDQSHCSGVISKLHCIPNPCRAVLRTRVHEFLVPVLTGDGLWVVDSPRVLSLCPSLWVIIVIKMQLKWTKSSAPQVNTVKAHDVTAAKTDWSCISVKTNEDVFMILWLDCFVYHHSTLVFCESCQNQFLWR